MEAETMVKRVIDGRAYNTDTSELVARSLYLNPENGDPHDVRIYRTRSGSYFLTDIDFTTSPNKHGVVPLTRESASAIVTNQDDRYKECNFKILDSGAELSGTHEPLPATANADSAVIFLRVSKVFKENLEKAAKDAGLSVNAWLLRTCEAAMQEDLTDRIEDVQKILNLISDGLAKETAKEALMHRLAISMINLDLTEVSARLVLGKDVQDAIAGVLGRDPSMIDAFKVIGEMTAEAFDAGA